MKLRTMSFAIVAMLAISAPTFAASESAAKPVAVDSIWITGRGLHSWRAISRDELILWASPSRPYLVKIWRPYSSLRFVNAIGVTTTVGRVTKFEKVIIDGQRLPIKSIVALDRETAKTLHWRKKES